MKINIFAIGKLKEKYFADAAQEYVKRCSRYADVSVVELPEAPQGKTPEEQQRIEGEFLLEKAKGCVVALDGKGELWSSEDLAEFIKAQGVSGAKEIDFLIGGSHGHSAELRKSVDKVVSFGKITLPHQLFRVVLCEQVYRALTINNNVKYHK